MKRMTRSLVFAFVSALVMMTGAAGVASAEDKTFEECMSRTRDGAAYAQLRKDGVVDLDKYPVYAGDTEVTLACCTPSTTPWLTIRI